LTGPEPVRGRPQETALSLVVAEADSVVADFRRRYLAATVAKRVPPHVTLLYPFATADAVDGGLISSLEELYASVRPFDFELARVGRFDAHVWLAPEPLDHFVELIRLTYENFPEYPAYGGEFAGSEPTPHLTIGGAGERTDIAALASIAERELGGSLPLPCVARTVSLLEEQPDGTWAKRAELPLGGR